MHPLFNHSLPVSCLNFNIIHLSLPPKRQTVSVHVQEDNNKPQLANTLIHSDQLLMPVYPFISVFVMLSLCYVQNNHSY